MRSPRPLSSRLGVVATAALLAAGVAGCGSDDDEPTASTGTTAATTAQGGTTTDAGGSTSAGGSGGEAPAGGGAPAQDEEAIRAAIRRGPEAVTQAKTARISLELKNAGINTTGEGVVELTTERYAMKQRLGGTSGQEIENYGEKGKVYVRTGSGGWSVTDNPVGSGDPLAQIRQLEKAKILRVRETAELDGTTCRWFDAEVAVKDVLGNIADPAAKALIEGAPDGAAIPVSSCVDDRGLTYAVDQEFSPAEVFGGAAASLPGTSVTKVRMSDYGEAPAPERPAGIDDAKPISIPGSGGATTN
ncbi:unannotated protein [freshwater metagenome]|uniref:Unannotated protein n=1 Tax=freshwater metagenome TaxID=449393 RepID=A0A6J7H3U6_9ZZZZ|nr:hypothetical protein [Actinomycetota bacterium]